MNLYEPRSGKVIRQLFDEAFSDNLDQWMKAQNFGRRSGSMIYSRRCSEATQKLEVMVQLHPSDNREASAAVYPQIVISMPAVEAKVAEMIGGHESLVGYIGPLRQPLEWLSEKKATARWYVYQQDSIPAIALHLRQFFATYASPFLDSCQRPEEFAFGHGQGDTRVPTTDEQALRVGAAMLLVGRTGDARELLGERFGKLGRRAKFAPILSFVGWHP